jgi:hypothetical protein
MDWAPRLKIKPQLGERMAETAQIAQVADKISKEIFGVLGWERRPHKDLNFPCTIREHNKDTHPSDVVFSYISPLEENHIFLNTDLKSYATNSIKSSKISTAANSLIMAVDCANASPVWRDRYGANNINYDVHGLLFVYNHDNKYDDVWPALVSDARVFQSKLKKKHRIYVLGPPDISYLLNIADDIKRQRGDEEKLLPFAEHCNFYYPDMINVRVKRNLNPAATLEMLTSPWQVLRYEKGGKEAKQSGTYVYYRGTGETVDEYKFLVDYLFRFQLVADGHIISIRMPNSVADASGRFETAKQEYWKDHHSLPEFKERLDRISFFKVARVRDHFDDTVIGMDD